MIDANQIIAIMGGITPTYMVRIFIDESGSPERYIDGYHESHDKYFTIAAVILRQVDYTAYKYGISELCLKYEKYLQGKELKSNYIRYSNPKAVKEGKTPAYIFNQFDDGLEKYYEFNDELKILIQNTDFSIVSVTTNKEVADQKYPHIPMHETLLCNLWERISIYHMINSRPRMKIVFDRTEGKSDLITKESYQFFKENGSKYFGNQRLAELELGKDVYSAVSDDSLGLQLADLMAYPIKKQLENGGNDFFSKIVKGKLHPFVTDKKSGKVVMMGTKRSLN